MIPRRNLIRDGHGRRRKDLLLFGRLLRLQLLLLLQPLPANKHLVEALAHIVEFKMGTGYWTGVLRVRVVLCVDALVIGEVNIVNVVVIVCHCFCVGELSAIIKGLGELEMKKISSVPYLSSF